MNTITFLNYADQPENAVLVAEVPESAWLREYNCDATGNGYYGFFQVDGENGEADKYYAIDYCQDRLNEEKMNGGLRIWQEIVDDMAQRVESGKRYAAYCDSLRNNQNA